MKSLWYLSCTIIFLLNVSFGALAKDSGGSGYYNSSLPFRPDNITGLTGMYQWVGSYYNATVKIELTPTIGYYTNESACDSLNGTTRTVREWSSILAITERGPYNVGRNPVNLWLSMIGPDSKWSDFGWQDLFNYEESIKWPLIASNPRPNPQAPRALIDGEVGDNFNITVEKQHASSFNLFGVVHRTSWVGDHPTGSLGDISMPACNDTVHSGDWTFNMITLLWPWLYDWEDFHYPLMAVSFDDHTANLTVAGKFSAFPYLRANATKRRPVPYTDGSGSTVRGDVRITFRGVLDTYHSDILNVNSSSPTWVRTVGFGNNSLNIGNDATSTGARFIVATGSGFIGTIFLFGGILLSLLAI